MDKLIAEIRALREAIEKMNALQSTPEIRGKAEPVEPKSKTTIALEAAKEWISSVEFCVSIGAYPLPSPDKLIAALWRLSDE